MRFRVFLEPFGRPENIRLLWQSTFQWFRLCDPVCFSEFAVHYEVCAGNLNAGSLRQSSRQFGALHAILTSDRNSLVFVIESKVIFKCQVDMIKA